MRRIYRSLARVDPRWLGAVAFLGAALTSAVYVLWLGRGQTLILDEWSYLLGSRGWLPSHLLEPHNGHLIVFPTLALKLIYGTVGISSHVPYQLLAVALNTLIAWLLYLFGRRSVGPMIALVPAILVLFCGAGWDAFVTGYQLPNLFGMAAGLTALLLVRRGDLWGDVLTCLALALALASFSVGVAFAAGIAMAMLLRGWDAALRRAWVVVAPGILYAAWFVWATQFPGAEVTAHNVGALLSGMLDQLAAVLSGITGLAATPGNGDLTAAAQRPSWGPTLVALAAIGVVLGLWRRRPSPTFVVALTVLLVYLATIALALGGSRVPDASRYIYLGSVLTLLVLVEAVDGMRPSRVWTIALAVALFFSLLANGMIMGEGGKVVRLESATNRAQLRALEIARDRVSADFVVESAARTTTSNPDMLFDARDYFDVVRSFGSPAYDEGELGAAPEQARESADLLLARALPISARDGFRPVPGPAITVYEGDYVRRGGGCVLLVPRSGQEARLSFAVPSGGLTYSVAAAGQPELKLKRFGEGFAVVPDLPLGSARVAIPTDRSSRPWEAELATGSRLELCP